MNRRLWVCLAAFTVVVAGCDWAQSGFNGSNTGADPTAVALSPASASMLHQAWSVSDPSGAAANLAVVGNSVYASSRGPTRFRTVGSCIPNPSCPTTTTTTTLPTGPPPPPPFEALDASDGSVRWTAGAVTVTQDDIHGQCVAYTQAAAPLVENGTVRDLSTVVTCADAPDVPFGQTSTLDASTGAATLVDASRYDVSSPVGDSRATYVTRRGSDHGAAPFTTDVLGTDGFDFPAPPGRALSGPTIDATSVFVSDGGGTLHAVDRASGAVEWTSAPGAVGNANTPSVGDGMVFVSTSTHLVAFDEAGQRGCSTTAGVTICAPVWDVALFDPSLPQFASTAPPTVSHHRLFLRRDNMIQVFDTNTGALLWQAVMSPATSTQASGQAPPSVAGSIVFVGTVDGKLQAYDTAGVAGCATVGSIDTCMPVWSAEVPGDASVARPVIAADAVYLSSGSSLSRPDGTSTITKFVL